MNVSKVDVQDLAPASQRLLALYPDLPFDREKAKAVLIERVFSRQAKALDQLPFDATLAELLATFRHDSSKEEFLWNYIEAITGEKDVHQKVY